MSTAVETDKMAALATAANEARGLAMDSIAAAHSGHMGLPLGAAEIGASLYGSQVSYHQKKSHLSFKNLPVYLQRYCKRKPRILIRYWVHQKTT
jgi:transketolase N-terminal domain/subunit